MKDETYVNIAVEDALSENMLRALFRQIAPHLKVAQVLHQGGYGYITHLARIFMPPPIPRRGLDDGRRGVPGEDRGAF